VFAVVLLNKSVKSNKTEMNEFISAHFGEIIELQVLIERQFVFGSLQNLLHAIVLDEDGGLHILGSSIPDIRLIGSSITNFKGLCIDHFDFVKSSINRFGLILFVYHTLHVLDMHNLAIFKGMLGSIQQSYYSVGCTCDTFNDNLYRLLSILVKYLKFVPKIIKDSAVCTPELCTYEFYIMLPTLLIELVLIFDAHLGYKYETVCF